MSDETRHDKILAVLREFLKSSPSLMIFRKIEIMKAYAAKYPRDTIPTAREVGQALVVATRLGWISFPEEFETGDCD